MKVLQELTKDLDIYQLHKDYQDDRLGYRCCELALTALENGCYGVGAVLFDNKKQILAEGRNEVFQNGFFSDRHAEMVILNLFEEQFPVYGDRSQLTMLVSLEPCPMCFTRLLLAGIGRVIYLAEDHNGGMLHRLDQMPDVWRNLAQLQTRRRAAVTPSLSSLAARLANCQLDQLRHKLLKAIRP
ncbi:MAG: nucleoside deaminase [Thermodesulfobacteriota bacterium]